jgi:glycosyltransferase involved in cell wall biosynthesis
MKTNDSAAFGELVKPKLSVCMTTFNHERFVTQAVNSALMQQTNFQIEIIIGEDCSTDRTREIVIELQRQHPDKIRLLLHDTNQGLLGKNNLVQTMRAARGEYIAFLEGDDFWTDDTKLQQQVDYLDAHPNCVEVFHDVEIFYEDASAPSRHYCAPDQKSRVELPDLLWGNFAPSMSTVYRRFAFGDFPQWFFELRMSDWVINLLNAQHGYLHYIPRVMASYRMHGGGIWSPLAATQTELQHLKLLDFADAHFEGKYHALIERIKPFRHYNLVKAYANNGEKAKSREHARMCMSAARAGNFGWSNAAKAMWLAR